jgi:hypothetical protein
MAGDGDDGGDAAILQPLESETGGAPPAREVLGPLTADGAEWLFRNEVISQQPNAPVCKFGEIPL